MRRSLTWIAAALCASATLVHADTPPAHAPPPPATPPQTSPPPVDVADPMLAPPEAATAVVHSWDEALSMIRRSPDFLASVAAVERAIAERRIALAGVIPQISAQGSFVHNFNTVAIPFGSTTLVEPPPTIWQATATASWSLTPRAIYGVHTADLGIDIANLSLADRRRVAAATAVSALLSTLAAERVAELARVGLKAALERLTLTQTRLQYARGTELDVDRAQQDVAAARASLIRGDEQLRQSRENLGQALGSPTPLAAPADLDLEGFESSVAQTCHLDTDVETRADVVAAKDRVAVADRQVEDAKLAYAPYLSLVAQAADASATTLGPTDTFTLAATLTVPLYTGGARGATLRDARAVADQARDELASLRIAASIELSRAGRAVSVDTSARDVAKQQRELAARVDQRTREGYAAGLGTSLDLVTSAQALRQADIDLVILDYQVAEARAGAVLANAECNF
jgi:outer membrane protein TolC|nr:TolC family protein [Kofleriaceae bacterium]